MDVVRGFASPLAVAVLLALLAACSSGGGKSAVDPASGGDQASADVAADQDATVGEDTTVAEDVTTPGDAADSGDGTTMGDGTVVDDPGLPFDGTTDGVATDPATPDVTSDVTTTAIDPADWLLKESATIADGKIVITNDVENDLGAVWYKKTFDLQKTFTLHFRMYFGTKDEEGADGLAFVLAKEPLANQNGEGIGYGGIEPSLIVEVDTYPNDGVHLGSDLHDPLADHIAIMRNGNPDHGDVANVDHVLDTNIEDGKEHDVKVVWEPATKTLKVYCDDLQKPVVTETLNDLAELFGETTEMYLGITGSTGAMSNLQYVVPVTLGGAATPSTICKGGWSLHGTAVLDGSKVLLTDEEENQAGAAWCDAPIDLAQPFDLSYTVSLGNRDENGADGIVLVIGKAPVVADIGEGIGYSGILDSVGIELDTYPNDGEHLGSDLHDPLADHVAVVANGISDHAMLPYKPVELDNIEDGKEHQVRVVWNPSQKKLSFYLDDLTTPVVFLESDLAVEFLGGDTKAYLGFTSATGTFYNLHYVLQ